jgi:UDP-N-acetylmuramyl pentapeptide synthase
MPQAFGGVLQESSRSLAMHRHRRACDDPLRVQCTARPARLGIVGIVGDYANVWTYGETASCNTQGSCIDGGAKLAVCWQFGAKQREHTLAESMAIHTQMFGRMNLLNVLAAIAMGTRFEVSPDLIREALEEFKPDNLKSQIMTKGTTTIILDAYNANPTSMKAAVQEFASIRSPRKIAILGEMLELGEHSTYEHQQVLASLHSMNLQDILLVGQCSGRRATVGRYFDSVDELLESIPKEALAGAHVLIKGSRGVGLERYVESLDWHA